jgi:hypothetical protein
MKRAKQNHSNEICMTVADAAHFFNVDRRTIFRWLTLGLPRYADGTIPFPAAGLWYQVWQHRCDNRCQRHPEADLMFFLQRAMKIMPEEIVGRGNGQRILRRLGGFELTPETLARIRAD